MNAPHNPHIYTMSKSHINLRPLIKIRNFFVNNFVQREAETIGILASLITGEPAILVGEPGTAKTLMIDTLAKLINARYFYYLLTRFTEPDELLGTLDINALRQGKYVRITTNRLPEAHIVFLDEIFKASSSIRNILLDIILNKRFLNGDHYVKLPMLTLYTASNEISTDEEDQAFYDRLTIRMFVKPVSDDSWSELILSGLELLDEINVKPVMTVEDIRAIQKYVIAKTKQLRENKSLIQKYVYALGVLKSKGITVSDRRKIKTLIVATAVSILYLEEQVSPDSLAEALRYTMIHDQHDIYKVEEAIMEAKLTSYYKHVEVIQTLISEIKNAKTQLDNKRDLESIKMASTVLKTVALKIKQLPRNPRLIPYIRQLTAEAEELKQRIDRIKEEIFGGV